MNLSRRLAVVASFVPKGATLADIGSDHAYLPIALYEAKIIKKAIAGEVAVGPLKNAENEVARKNLSDAIEVRLGDGLEVIQYDDQIDTVTIAGMGGFLIRDILEAGKARLGKNVRLILQANIAESSVREWLNKNSFKVVDEAIVEDHGKVYEIIVAEKGHTDFKSLNETELFFGRFVEKYDPELFQKKWSKELLKRKSILASLKDSKGDQKDAYVKIEGERKLIEERIK